MISEDVKLMILSSRISALETALLEKFPDLTDSMEATFKDRFDEFKESLKDLYSQENIDRYFNKV